MGIDYVWEKFHTAVSVLASGDGSIQKRLTTAFSYSLTRLKLEQFPTKKSRERYDQLIAIATAKGSFESSIEALSDEKCSELAKEIVSLSDGISQEFGIKMGHSLLE